VDEPDPRGYVAGMCVGIQRKLGSVLAFDLVCLQQQLSGDYWNAAIRSTLWTKVPITFVLGQHRREKDVGAGADSGYS
jgi:hypothetical protein